MSETKSTAELTAKQRVLARYPDAEIWLSDGFRVRATWAGYKLVFPLKDICFHTEQEAWEAFAATLKPLKPTTEQVEELYKAAKEAVMMMSGFSYIPGTYTSISSRRLRAALAPFETEQGR